tara:strand:+ start:126 stop:611 length:486 start_codon:yes stop_codon:yes gene_type:complete
VGANADIQSTLHQRVKLVHFSHRLRRDERPTLFDFGPRDDAGSWMQKPEHRFTVVSTYISGNVSLEGAPMADEKNLSDSERTLSPIQHIICGWPLMLVVIGGLIGGACGGAAYGINAKLLKSDLSPGLKYLLVVLVGVGAIAAYFLVVIGLAILWPNIFGK